MDVIIQPCPNAGAGLARLAALISWVSNISSGRMY